MDLRANHHSFDYACSRESILIRRRGLHRLPSLSWRLSLYLFPVTRIEFLSFLISSEIPFNYKRRGLLFFLNFLCHVEIYIEGVDRALLPYIPVTRTQFLSFFGLYMYVQIPSYFLPYSISFRSLHLAIEFARKKITETICRPKQLSIRPLFA